MPMGYTTVHHNSFKTNDFKFLKFTANIFTQKSTSMDNSLTRRTKNIIFKFEAHTTDESNENTSFTLDFEEGRYRQKELVGLIRDIAPYFALTEKEIASLDRSDWNRRSFCRISDAHKNSKGDYGELLLYILLNTFQNTPKFVTKARLRSCTREQIKGFDCAHFSLESNNTVSLWLGEAKFHQNFSTAVSSALTSLSEHITNSEKIKSELRLLGGEIEINKQLEPEKYALLEDYVNGGKSLEKIPIRVPVLITYDSDCIKNFHGSENADIENVAFREMLLNELEVKFKTIKEKSWPSSKNIKIIFFIMPMHLVSEIKTMLDQLEQVMKF
ncbi:hypothetical protein DB032_12415 [Chromobacterium sp. Panama]|uniref:HamA C-terminal domain-containing protein n=1 Tax=Chromobacterium sp. Panama TaxID=2161826 RepID=UPI000D31C01A|nr:DUF1837 domain-containing protein [Chromobacterium sp. Panama]PTU65683.1 hypothetical protein DB032_12415 [Chromobacterium sp. Panama]